MFTIGDSAVKTMWLAVRADNRGTAEIYGAYTHRGLAEQRLKLAIDLAARRQFWHLAQTKEFKVVEVPWPSGALTEETKHEPIILSSTASGIFSASGQ